MSERAWRLLGWVAVSIPLALGTAFELIVGGWLGYGLAPLFYAIAWDCRRPMLEEPNR